MPAGNARWSFGTRVSPSTRTREQAAKAQKRARREAEKEWDCFDYWLAEVAQRVRQIVAEYVPPEVQRAREEFATLEYGEDIPF
jgi:hypothetical protein